MNFWKAYGNFYIIVSDCIIYYTQSEFLLMLFALLNLPFINSGLLRGLE